MISLLSHYTTNTRCSRQRPASAARDSTKLCWLAGTTRRPDLIGFSDFAWFRFRFAMFYYSFSVVFPVWKVCCKLDQNRTALVSHGICRYEICEISLMNRLSEADQRPDKFCQFLTRPFSSDQGLNNWNRFASSVFEETLLQLGNFALKIPLKHPISQVGDTVTPHVADLETNLCRWRLFDELHQVLQDIDTFLHIFMDLCMETLRAIWNCNLCHMSIVQYLCHMSIPFQTSAFVKLFSS